MTLTSRLTATLVGTVAAVLLGFSVTLHALVSRHLHRQIEDHLGGTLNTLQAAAEVDADGVEWDRTNRTVAVRRLNDREVRWAVYGDGPDPIDGSGDPPLPAFDPRPGTFRHADATGRDWLVAVRAVAPPSPPTATDEPTKHPRLTFVAAADAGPVAATLRALTAALAGVSAAVLAGTLLIARRVGRRVLRPVAVMADQAREITAEAFDARLTVPPGGDELAAVGAAFNALLDRLQVAYERQRQFAGNASHQLRTPLAGLLGQVDVCLRRPRTDGEYRAVLDTVRRSGERLTHIVESLLFLARAEADAGVRAVEPIDLSAWLADWRAGLGPHPRAADLTVSCPAPAVIRGHPGLLVQLLGNLFDNAAKFSPPGSPIRVSVEPVDGQAVLAVEDAGCGIPAADLPHLFTPFFRTDAARRDGLPGVGLGLCVVERIARAHAAAVAVSSEPGCTRVAVRFPAAG